MRKPIVMQSAWSNTTKPPTSLRGVVAHCHGDTRCLAVKILVFQRAWKTNAYCTKIMTKLGYSHMAPPSQPECTLGPLLLYLLNLFHFGKQLRFGEKIVNSNY